MKEIAFEQVKREITIKKAFSSPFFKDPEVSLLVGLTFPIAKGQTNREGYPVLIKDVIKVLDKKIKEVGREIPLAAPYYMLRDNLQRLMLLPIKESEESLIFHKDWCE